MASQQVNEVEEMINGLRNHPGFKSYLILNNDGVVIKWGQEGSPMPYEKAVQQSHHLLDLYKKSKACLGDLFGPEEGRQIECVRLRTDEYELIVAQEGNYTLVVAQEEEAKTAAATAALKAGEADDDAE